ncbi:Transcription factor lepE [Paramyrothecium foliicola]|nr:Transcription factor lepE [Paramyrothecium foliicola]
MEALTIFGAVTGSISVASEILKALDKAVSTASRFKDAPEQAISTMRDLKMMRANMLRFKVLLDNQTRSRDRGIHIPLEDARDTFTDCVASLDELENLTAPLGNPALQPLELVERLEWTMKDKRIEILSKRLHDAQSSLGLMLTILSHESLLEVQKALASLPELTQRIGANVAYLNRRMSSNNRPIPVRSGDENDDHKSSITRAAPAVILLPSPVSTLRSGPTNRVATTDESTRVGSAPEGIQTMSYAFEKVLVDSRPYRRAPRWNQDDTSYRSSVLNARALSLLSNLSNLSLGDVSTISFVALPLICTDLSNAQHYKFGNAAENTHPIQDSKHLENPHLRPGLPPLRHLRAGSAPVDLPTDTRGSETIWARARVQSKAALGPVELAKGTNETLPKVPTSEETSKPLPCAVKKTTVHNQDHLEGRWHSSDAASILLAPPTPVTLPHSNNQSPQDPQLPFGQQHSRDGDDQACLIAQALNTNSDIVRHAIYKSIYVSPSSWIHSVLLVSPQKLFLLFHVIVLIQGCAKVPSVLEWYENEIKDKGKFWQAIQDSKSYANQLKISKAMPWSAPDYGHYLPLWDQATILLDAYLRTFESTHRILHIPTFKRDYDLLWSDRSATTNGFIVQAQLCFALGSALYDETFSLRPRAEQWIREAESWLETSQPTILSIQTMCLLSLARAVIGEVDNTKFWVYTGLVVKSAMSIGLHRDPGKLPSMPPAQAEIRRRLWTTVLELLLQSCLDAGGAPLLSCDDYDCNLPANLDDTQLDFSSSDKLEHRELEHLTDSTLQILLGRSLSLRLTIVGLMSGIKTTLSYDETLRLNAQLTTARSYLFGALDEMRTKVSTFQRHYCYMTMSSYVFTLHIPFMTMAPANPTYLLSRNLCIDTALHLSYCSMPLSSTNEPLFLAVRSADILDKQSDDFARLSLCGSGLFRAVQFQAIMVVAAELFLALDTVDVQSRLPNLKIFRSCGGSLRNLELLSIIRTATDWSRRRILAGQVNIQDHVFITAMVACANAMVEGSPASDFMVAKSDEACIEARNMLIDMIEKEGLVPEGEIIEAEREKEDLDFWTANLDFGMDFGSFV